MTDHAESLLDGIRNMEDGFDPYCVVDLLRNDHLEPISPLEQHMLADLIEGLWDRIMRTKE
jgi:hypothetical protein